MTDFNISPQDIANYCIIGTTTFFTVIMIIVLIAHYKKERNEDSELPAKISNQLSPRTGCNDNSEPYHRYRV